MLNKNVFETTTLNKLACANIRFKLICENAQSSIKYHLFIYRRYQFIQCSNRISEFHIKTKTNTCKYQKNKQKKENCLSMTLADCCLIFIQFSLE